MAAESTYVKSNAHGSLVLADGTGTPITKAVAYDKGDVSISGLKPVLNDVVHVTRRGRYVSSHLGARAFPTLSFSCFLPNVVGSTAVAPGSVLEFLSRLGAYSANVNPLGTGRPSAVNLILTVEGTNFGDTADETWTCNRFVPTSFEIKEEEGGNTLSVSGDIVGTIVFVNNTNTVTYQEIS